MPPKVRVSETEFQRAVVDYLNMCGWRHLHVRKSMGRRNGTEGWQTTTSIKGWPDLLAWKPGRIVAIELKSDTGRATPEQLDVLASLSAAGVETFIWRPSDWPEIEKVMR